MARPYCPHGQYQPRLSLRPHMKTLQISVHPQRLAASGFHAGFHANSGRPGIGLEYFVPDLERVAWREPYGNAVVIHCILCGSAVQTEPWTSS